MKIEINHKWYLFEYLSEMPTDLVVNNSKYIVQILDWFKISENIRVLICSRMNYSYPDYPIIDVDGINTVGFIINKNDNKMYLLIEPMYGTIEMLEEIILAIEKNISCINLFNISEKP